MNNENVVEANGYTFATDQNGTVTVTGDLQSETAARDGAMQANAGGSARLATDDGGHLVAARANGPAIEQNLSAQDRNLNRSSFKAMETAEQNAIKGGAKISTERTAFVSNDVAVDGSRRPDAYIVNDHITFSDGKTQDVHLSFSNMSKAEQAQMNEQTSAIFDTGESNPGDGLRGQMTTEEYTQLMEETDPELPSFQDEFSEWDVSTANQAANNAVETDEQAAVSFTAEEALDANDSATSVTADDFGADVSSESEGTDTDASADGDADSAGADIGGDGDGASPSDD